MLLLPLLVVALARHSRESGNPVTLLLLLLEPCEEPSHWIPAFAGMTSEKVMRLAAHHPNPPSLRNKEETLAPIRK